MPASDGPKHGLADMFRNFQELQKCPHEIWIIFAMKFLEATAMFGTTFVLVKFLSEELGMSDVDAGWVYGGFGMMVSVVGLCIGFMVDNLGVRMSLVTGGMLLLASRTIVTFSTSAWQVTATFLTMYPMGTALALPVQMMALKRYTDDHTRQFAFSLFYVIMNISATVAAILIHALRDVAKDGIVVAGMNMSMYRLVLLTGVFCTVVMLILSALVREITTNTAGEVQAFQPRSGNAMDIGREVLSNPKFWRFFAITVIFVGVKSNFSHMDATFPKYYTREFGKDAAYEVLLSINPVCIIFFVPVATYLIHTMELSFPSVLIIGSIFSGIAPFAIAASNTLGGSVVWLILLSIGEAIWSPKLMEFSVAIAPEGREGTYLALAGAPLFLSKLGVGGLSGYLLTTFCPEEGPRNSQMMWFVIGLTTFFPSLILIAAQKWLLVPKDWDREAAPSLGDSEDGRSETNSRTKSSEHTQLMPGAKVIGQQRL